MGLSVGGEGEIIIRTRFPRIKFEIFAKKRNEYVVDSVVPWSGLVERS